MAAAPVLYAHATATTVVPAHRAGTAPGPDGPLPQYTIGLQTAEGVLYVFGTPCELITLAETLTAVAYGAGH